MREKLRVSPNPKLHPKSIKVIQKNYFFDISYHELCRIKTVKLVTNVLPTILQSMFVKIEIRICGKFLPAISVEIIHIRLWYPSVFWFIILFSSENIIHRCLLAFWVVVSSSGCTSKFSEHLLFYFPVLCLSGSAKPQNLIHSDFHTWTPTITLPLISYNMI